MFKVKNYITKWCLIPPQIEWKITKRQWKFILILGGIKGCFFPPFWSHGGNSLAAFLAACRWSQNSTISFLLIFSAFCDSLPSIWRYWKSSFCQNRTETENLKCGKYAENVERYRGDRRDVASTYVLRPRLGIKLSRISDGAEKRA